MPGMVDKIIINSGSTRGNHASIKARYEVLNVLGRELIQHDLLTQAEPIKEKMAQYCADHNAADKKYINSLDSIISAIAALIDSKLFPPQP